MTWKQALDIEQKVQSILVNQEIAGVNFASDKACYYIEEIEQEKFELYSKVRPFLSYDLIIDELKEPEDYLFEFVGQKYRRAKGTYKFVKKIFTKAGEYTAPVKSWLEDAGYGHQSRIVSGPFSRISWEEPSISKREKLTKHLLRLGWKPTVFSETGIPKLTVKGEPVDSLYEIEGEVGKNLARWYVLAHRQGQMKGLLEGVRQDGKVTAYCTGGVTNTYRRKHRLVK